MKVQVSCASSPFRGFHVLALSRDCFLAPSHLLTKATSKEKIRTIAKQATGRMSNTATEHVEK